ncbi:MAG: DUF357 domain-containing protein [Methanocalculus sp.]|uniref:DUF357 domain-containing protein n=1 Tax=Methanocalculus sp. TaxID=2004547 RepID=UPI0027230BFA|nr:DUF357 domain-containing protein [Methanocalculus sp.]MDO9539992.1 DUF357 domain-containing protein [Methanocalculus sp.]
MITDLASLSSMYLRSLEGVSSPLVNTSPLRLVADQILEMAWAYQKDGEVFLRSDDQVNALASWCYGYGWLDAGSYLGLLSRTDPFSGFAGDIHHSYAEKLREKTFRYQRMLSAASAAVNDAPDASSPLCQSCTTFREIIFRWQMNGDDYLVEGLYASALASFSYGYGWLDSGVRSGIFQIRGDRHLFTA